MHIFHKWTPWVETWGGYRDMYFGYILRETPLLHGYGRECTYCGKEQFRVEEL